MDKKYCSLLLKELIDRIRQEAEFVFNTEIKEDQFFLRGRFGCFIQWFLGAISGYSLFSGVTPW